MANEVTMRDNKLPQITTPKDHVSSLTPTQIDVLAALLSGESIKSAAEL